MGPTPRVLLVAPPWRPPTEGNLGLATLKPMLQAAGFEVGAVYGSLLMPQLSPPAFKLLNAYSGSFFGYWLEAAATGKLPERKPYIDAFVARYLANENLDGLVVPGATSVAALGVDETLLRESAAEVLEACGVAIDRLEEAVTSWQPNAIGLSSTFEGQLPAALALVRRMRRKRPNVPMVLGGAACFSELGEALAQAFPEVTAVCHAEGEGVVVPLFEAVTHPDKDLEDVPGIAFQQGTSLRVTHAPPLLTAMDTLPIPDYGDFVADLEASHWAAPPRLFFETSRGCWWGQKTLCTFCGLNADGLSFRSKSPERAVAEIRALYGAYPTAGRLLATDNIMEMAYFDQVLPQLQELAADANRPLRLFYEIKPNLRKDQVRALRAGGVDVVQPGIESYSDGVLAVMRKGNTALGQLQFVKWATEFGIWPSYNLLVRNPGEDSEDYERMLALIDRIDHLPPPSTVSHTWLERFSPYFMQPETHGLTNIRARSHYAYVYPDATVPLDALAYVFDYDHPICDDPVFIDVHHRFVRRVGLWQYHWRPGKLFYVEDQGTVRVIDRRSEEPDEVALSDDLAAVWRALDRARGPDAVQRDLPDIDVARVVAELVDRGWAVRDERGRALVVVPQGTLST